MGVNLVGKNGNQFDLSWSCWSPIAEYCNALESVLCKKCKHWFSNDGAGLNAIDSAKLGKSLLKSLSNGQLDHWRVGFLQRAAAIPLKHCDFCGGFGVRDDIFLKGICNSCGGKGYYTDHRANRDLHKDLVKEFAEFLINSHGFEIW